MQDQKKPLVWRINAGGGRSSYGRTRKSMAGESVQNGRGQWKHELKLKNGMRGVKTDRQLRWI